jgi:hypothetical protein
MKQFIFMSLLFASTYLGAQETLTRAEAEDQLAERMTERVQEITGRIEARLSALAPMVETMASESSPGKTLSLWMQDGKAQKLEVIEAETEMKSVYYFADEELFFVSQPYSHFIFIGGQLEYWLNEEWEHNRVTRELLSQREGLLYDEVNSYLVWLYERF